MVNPYVNMMGQSPCHRHTGHRNTGPRSDYLYVDRAARCSALPPPFLPADAPHCALPHRPLSRRRGDPHGPVRLRCRRLTPEPKLHRFCTSYCRTGTPGYRPTVRPTNRRTAGASHRPAQVGRVLTFCRRECTMASSQKNRGPARFWRAGSSLFLADRQRIML